MPAETQVLIIDDPTLFAVSLCTVLQLDGFDARRLDADHAVEHADQAPRHVAEHAPIAVLDLELESRWNPLDLITTFSALGTRVLVVTASDDASAWTDCLARGAAQVVSKTAPMGDIVDIVHRLRDGQSVLDATERLGLLAERQRQTQERRELLQRFSQLNHVEHWVLECLVAGRGMHEIARDGRLAPVQVRTHVHSIVEKLNVTSWLEAVVLATDPAWPWFDDVS